MSALLGAIVLATASALASTGPAYAVSYGAEIYNHGSGKCVTVQNGSTAMGAPIVQEPCTSAPGQHWVFLGQTGGMRQIYSLDSGLCMFATNLTNASPIVQEPCSFIDTTWSFTDLGTPLHPVRIMKIWGTNTCLDLENGWTFDGLQLQVWSCNSNTNNQKWDVISAPPPA